MHLHFNMSNMSGTGGQDYKLRDFCRTLIFCTVLSRRLETFYILLRQRYTSKDLFYLHQHLHHPADIYKQSAATPTVDIYNQYLQLHQLSVSTTVNTYTCL